MILAVYRTFKYKVRSLTHSKAAHTHARTRTRTHTHRLSYCSYILTNFIT